MSERQIEYVLYPFREEEEIYLVGKSMSISSTEFARQGSKPFIYELIKESFPLAEGMEILEPVEVFETLEMADNETLGDNLLIHCRVRMKMKTKASE
ncbi:MAG: hypothetical protein ACE15F_23810 [bacterium]